jgi:uncharacterized protein (TIGR03437 family)
MYGYTQVLVQVESNGVLSDVVPLTMSPAAPYVFTNPDATAIVINQDGSVNSASNPAAPGSIITSYGSGFGETAPQGTDGHLATVPLPGPTLPLYAEVGAVPASLLYAGDAAGQVEGIIQVNLRLPASAYEGDVEVAVGNDYMEFTVSVSHGGTR